MQLLKSLTFLAFLPYQDLGSDMPTKVKGVKSKIRGADVILIATPEYNLSVPEALNNAIDWASRPYGSPMVILIPSVISATDA
jgi:chromate reductase